MSIETYFLGDVGVALKQTTGFSWTGATAKQVTITRPSGTVITKTATSVVVDDASSGQIHVLTASGDLSETGEYLFQAKLTTSTVTRYGPVTSFKVESVTDSAVVSPSADTILRRTYDVGSYGAIGDGFTDDTAAIQAAIDAAEAAGGGEVFFPAGTYRINSQLLINDDGITLRGTGPYSSVIQSNFAGIAVYCKGTVGTNVNNFVLGGLQVTSTATYATTALRIESTVHFRVEDAILWGENAATSGGIALKICGSAYGTVANVLGQVKGNITSGGIGLDLGDRLTDASPTVTLTGPIAFSGCHFQAPINGIHLHGAYINISFHSCSSITVGGVTTNLIDGDFQSSVSFIEHHGEQSWDEDDLGEEFLIGANPVAAQHPGSVSIIGGSFWGNGNVGYAAFASPPYPDHTDFRKYCIRVVACDSLEIHGPIISRDGQASGFDSGAIRFESGYPATGQKANITGLSLPDVTIAYSDGNSVIPGAYVGDLKLPQPVLAADPSAAQISTALHTLGLVS